MKKSQYLPFSRWQISGFVQYGKQKFIQSARGIIVSRHKANEMRGWNKAAPAPQGGKFLTKPDWNAVGISYDNKNTKTQNISCVEHRKR